MSEYDMQNEGTAGSVVEDDTVEDVPPEMVDDEPVGERLRGSRERRKKRSDKKMQTGAIIFIVFVVLWGAAVYFGYNYAKDYIDDSLANLRQENAMSVKEVREDLVILGSEIRNMRESMENAGLMISSTSDVQSRIDSRLVELEKQLAKLEKSLNVLKEAP